MAHLLRMEEWQSTGTGKWYCNDTSEIGKSAAGLWYTPARMLDMPLDKFVKMLVYDFEVDYISFGKTLIYSWDSQTKMRKFKNFINAEARKRNYIC